MYYNEIRLNTFFDICFQFVKQKNLKLNQEVLSKLGASVLSTASPYIDPH